jgi:SAM-dependent methyltransferase
MSPSAPRIAFSWERNAAAWARWVRHGDPHRRVLLDPAVDRLLGRLRGLEVIDLGCGEGRYARRMARAGARVLGVDLAPSLVRRARASSAGRVNPRFAVADMQRLAGIPEGRFDRALAYLSLVSVPRLDRALHEAARVLRPGGSLVAVIPHPCFMAPGSGWDAELPAVLRHGAPLLRRLFVGRYYEPGRERFRFAPSFPAATVNYHRPLSAYLEGLVGAGLVLRRWLEPRPSAARARRDPAWIPYRRVPFFVVWAARRPGSAEES